MFSQLRSKFGIPGVISVIALVFAMLGGAYAAKSSEDNSGGAANASSKEVRIVKAGKQGKQGKRGKPGPRGPAGATGPAGPAGPVGATGSQGGQGSPGADGTDGADGADGVSVTSEEFDGAGGTCADGGVEFESASPTPAYACNGQAGSPWAAGGVLPSKATETGAWTVTLDGEGKGRTAISFPIPLAAALTGPSVKTINVGGTPPEECENTEHTGTASPTNPEAKPGFLCVYAANAALAGGVNPGVVVRAGASFSTGVSTSGGVITFEGGTAGAIGWGTWAVTGA